MNGEKIWQVFFHPPLYLMMQNGEQIYFFNWDFSPNLYTATCKYMILGRYVFSQWITFYCQKNLMC